MGGVTEEASKVLLLLLGIGGKPENCSLVLSPKFGYDLDMVLPLDGTRVSLEPVRNENLVLVVFIASRKDIGTLQCLVEITENVVYGYNSLGSLCRASDV